ncbi:MAG TPA: hypothetical protein VEQ41_06190 [Solirubrobacterales bacterium]|nr:hypothetical protein [Solirubrobacterales bacterium]
MAVEALSYAIDDQDRLTRLDGGYYRFAEENGWREAEASLGRSLWDFVAGEDVQKILRLLVRRIRDGVRDVELTCRCDGPEVARELDLRIAATSSGRGVLFAARVRSEVAWNEPQPLLDPGAPRGEERLPMCAWCDRFEVDGDWVEAEEAAKRLELFRRSEFPALEHTVCPRDRETLLAA